MTSRVHDVLSAASGRARRPRPVGALAAVAALTALTGCATAPERTAQTPRTGWHDPEFYTPWHDPKAIVLPPPPFTGFSSAGKTEPMLPNRPRPEAAPLLAPAP